MNIETKLNDKNNTTLTCDSNINIWHNYWHADNFFEIKKVLNFFLKIIKII